MDGKSGPVSLASGVLPEFDPATTARAAVHAGFDAVGLWVEPPNWAAGLSRDVRDILAGLPVLDVEVIWIRPGPDDPDHFRLLDIGAEVGAANALVVSSDPDAGATAAKFRRLCEHAEGSGIRVALEFGLFTEVKTLGGALDILGRVDHPSSALLVDAIHLSRSGGSPAQLAEVPTSLLSYAQLCDAGPEAPDPGDAAAIIDEAVNGRLLLGEGVLPLGALLRSLPAAVPLSIELRSKALRDAYPDPFNRALALARSTRAYLEQ